MLKMLLNKPKRILLHKSKWLNVLLCITNNSIKHQSFVYTQINDQTVLFQTIQFSISHLFFVCLFGFYGILTFVGYLIPNSFL